MNNLTIISGGDTGVDLAALTTATSLDIPTSGYAPHGWQTESGPAPWLSDYGLTECPTPGYAARTEFNVYFTHGTLIVTHEPANQLTGGTKQTLDSTGEHSSKEA